MNKNTSEPAGELILRTLAMPADTNPQGDIFGGWIMAQMDIAGGIMANEIARYRVVTVAVESINFIKPVHVGDVVGCYGKVIRIGRTSITINLEVWVKAAQFRITEEMHMFKVTQAAFTYVAVNSEGKKQPVLRDTMSVL